MIGQKTESVISLKVNQDKKVDHKGGYTIQCYLFAVYGKYNKDKYGLEEQSPSDDESSSVSEGDVYGPDAGQPETSPDFPEVRPHKKAPHISKKPIRMTKDTNTSGKIVEIGLEYQLRQIEVRVSKIEDFVDKPNPTTRLSGLPWETEDFYKSVEPPSQKSILELTEKFNAKISSIKKEI